MYFDLTKACLCEGEKGNMKLGGLDLILIGDSGPTGYFFFLSYFSTFRLIDEDPSDRYRGRGKGGGGETRVERGSGG